MKNNKRVTTIYKEVTSLASPRSEVKPHICLPVCGAPWWVLLQHTVMLQLFFIVECRIACFLGVMCVFEVRASSLSPGQPLCQILFLSQPPLLS